jgi:hypothetical protein
MPLPPGLELLLEDVLPRALGLPLLTFGVLKLVQYQLNPKVIWPSWAWVVALLFIHPLAWIVSELYGQVRRKREAMSRGAVFPPMVKESSFKTVRAFRESALTG